MMTWALRPHGVRTRGKNSESEADSPHIVVGTYEGVCPSSTFAALPDTPRLAGACEYGFLDGNLGQMASFQSTYKSTLRIEVPVWPEVQQAVLTTNEAKCHPGRPMTAPPFPPDGGYSQGVVPGPHTQVNATNEPTGAGNIEDEEEEEEEDDTYVPPDGQGCFSFRQSLLLRAKDTYAARSMAPHWPCGSPLTTQLADSGQKRYIDVHPSRTTQALLSTRTPGWPC